MGSLRRIVRGLSPVQMTEGGLPAALMELAAEAYQWSDTAPSGVSARHHEVQPATTGEKGGNQNLWQTGGWGIFIRR